MNDERKTKAQLVREMTALRAKLKRIEKPAAKRKRISRSIVANEKAGMGQSIGEFGGAPCLLTSAQDITGHRQMERGVSEGEERYRGLVEGSPEAIVLHCEGSIVYVNSAGVKLFGVQSPAELVGTSIFDFIHLESREGALERFEQMPLGHAVRLNDEKLVRHDGNTIYVDVTFIPTAVLGKPALQVMLRDITEHKQAERQLREAKEQYQQLVENINEVIFSLDDGGIITYVSPAISAVGGYLPAELSGRPFSDLILPEDLKIANSGLQRVIRGELGPSEFRVLTKSGHVRWVRSSSRPIVKQGNTIGITGVLNDITEDKWAKEGLSLLGQTIRSIRECVSVTDAEDKILFVNEAFLKTYGYTHAELVGKPISIVRSTTESGVEDVLHATLQGGWQGELVNRKKDGTEFPIALSTSIIRNDEGRTLGLVGIAEDISERKRAEEALRNREGLLQRIFDVLPVGLWFADKDGKLLRGNPAGVKIWGAEPKASLSEYGIFKARRLPSGEEVAPDDWALAHTIRDKVIIIDELLEIDAFDGKKKTILNYTAPVLDAQGDVQGAIVVNQDITERKRAEETLRESEERYRLLLENAGLGVAYWDVNGKSLFFNEKALSHMGGRGSDYLGRSVCELYGKHLGNVLMDRLRKAAGSEKSEGYEDLVSLPTGERWFHSTYGAVRDVNRTVIGVQVISDDITERKRAEDALRVSEERYHRLADDFPGGIVTMYDKDLRLTFVAGSDMKKYGSKAEDFIGKHFTELAPPETFAIAEPHLRGAFEGQTSTYKTPYWGGRFYDVSVAPLHDTDGMVKEILVVSQDITERTRAGERIEEERNLLRSIINAIPDEIVVKDLERRFVLANEGCLCALGKQTLDQVIGLRDEDLIPERLASDGREKENRVLTSGETLFNDIPAARRNRDTGELERAIMSTKTPLYDRSGHLIGLVTVNRNITELLRTQENLGQSESRFRTVWDNVHDAMRLTDADGTIVMVNQSYCKLFKKESLELIGRSLAEPYLPIPNENIVEHYCERFRNHTIAPFLEADVTIWNGERLCLDSSNKFMSVPDQPELLLSVFRDITERKQVKERLEEERILLTTLIDTIPDEIAVKDIENRFVLVNPACLRALRKKSPADVLGKKKEDLIPEEFANDARLQQEPAIATGELFLDADEKTRLNPITGEIEKSVIVSKSPLLDKNGATTGFVVVNRDITARKRAEALLSANQNELHLLAGHLQSVREEERKHLSQEFHDQLGQTLTALKMDLALLQRELADKTRDVSRQILGEKLKSMHELIDGGTKAIREIMSELHPELLDQLGLVTALEWEAERFQKRSGIACRFTSVLDEFPIDPKKSIALFRIFQEAVTNVARHAHATLVEISMRREDGHVILEIKDNGIGIEPNAEHKLRSFGLIGMRERAILLGGTLEITGIGGRGTTILVRMPYEQTQPHGGLAL